MFCQKCGNKLDDNAKFCTRCGTPTSISLNEVKNSENKSNRNTSSPLDTDTEDYIYIPPKRPVSIEKACCSSAERVGYKQWTTFLRP